MFRPVSSKTNFPEMEEGILRFWKEKQIFQQSIDRRRGGPRFTLYEGPPTANGRPGIHHVLSRVFKDVIPRHRVMKGYFAPRIAGWDTHGLPVELEVEKELGLTSKPQIEEYGIARFNQRCRESVFRYLKDWDALTERIAYWVDLAHPYITMNNDYIESVWWALKQMWDSSLIYQGYRVTPHCPRCGTSLSSHEVALGYQDDVEDPSVYIKFRVVPASLKGSEAREQLHGIITASGKPAYLLAWTTTPWTLPANTALAVNPDAEYAVVETDDGYIIMASRLLVGAGLEERPIVMKITGNEIVGLEYEPLFNPHDFGIERLRFESGGELRPQAPRKDLTYRVIAGDFVSMEDGVGIVHVAPSYGEVDYEAGEKNGLDFVHVVDLQGRMTGSYPFSGLFVKMADPVVLEDLKKRGLLYRRETIRHTYPFCWRCGTPLLYYAKQTWYIRTTAKKGELIAGNEHINWYPEHIKYGRFGDWLQNNVDWAFSRERYWGTPLPVWRCESCGRYECIGSVKELSGKPGITGFIEPLDLHRPFVDEISYACPGCGEKMRRVTDVIDCWFDSGAMPFAQYHYPFENESMMTDGRFPADFICEAVDQTRGWFYSLHAISTLLFDKPGYRNVICLGHILDAKGEKMSKTHGNVVVPGTVISKHGADALRWYFYTSSPPGNVRRFEEKMVAEVTRRFLMTLWNVYSFFVTYANIDNFVPGKESTTAGSSELDRWITSELNQLVLDVDTGLENYDPTSAGRRIEDFVDILSNWYVRRSRRRFWKSENDTDKLSAYSTLYECLVTLTKLLAPFTPFVAEVLYQNLVRSVSPDAVESVHLADFPVAAQDRIDRQLCEDTRVVMKIASLGRAARSKAGIKVRQPLADILVKVEGSREEKGLERLLSQLLDELNVKGVRFVDKAESLGQPGYAAGVEGGYGVAVPLEVSLELQAEGMARELTHRLQMMRRAAGFDIADHIVTYYEGEGFIQKVMGDFADYIRQETLSEQIVQGLRDEGVFTEKLKVDGHEVMLGVRKL